MNSSKNLQIQREQKLQDAKLILKDLGLDRDRQNDRSAWTLLALLNIRPSSRWSSAKNPLLPTVIIMEFIKDEYGQAYKPNTRETIRRQTLHQFEQFMLVIRNKDDPSRATNSKNNNYSVTDEALEAIKCFTDKSWESKAINFQKNIPALLKTQQTTQSKHKIKFALPSGKNIELSPGKHNQLHADIVTDFIPRFIGNKNAEVLYIGDTASSREREGGKLMHLNSKKFDELGLPNLNHDKLPDLVVFDNSQKWLFLIETVTSHGPVSVKRYIELSKMFKSTTIPIVYVTAFPDSQEFRKNAADIAWETEVWISSQPEHMIHFNGDKFLGPHKK